MIYTIRVKCVGGLYWRKPFERTLEIESKTTLDELHRLIQSLTGFDDDHCYDFFIGRTPYNVHNSFGQGDDTTPASPKLQKIALDQVFPLPEKQKLFYWFDFGDDWKFEICLKKTATRQTGIKYPRCIAEKGPRPEQYPLYEE